MNQSGDRDRDTRRAFRRFVRSHHPDVGGNPNAFIAGLASFGRGPGGGQRHNRDTESRFDAPIVFVHRRRGLRRLVAWMADRWAARRRPPRVQ